MGPRTIASIILILITAILIILLMVKSQLSINILSNLFSIIYHSIKNIPPAVI